MAKPIPRKANYTFYEAANVLGVSAREVRSWVVAGHLPAEPLFRPYRLTIARQVLVQCAANSTRSLSQIPDSLRSEVERVRRRESKARKKLNERGLFLNDTLPLPVRD